MRLTDLDANFVGDATPAGRRLLNSVEGAQGVHFQCPRCALGKVVGPGYVEGAHYVLCWFINPRNAPPVPDDLDPGPGRWTFSGDTLDTLTLTPSVHLTGNGCGWHGWVKNGDAT